MYPTVIIVDDFYPDPHKIREVALGFDYPSQDGNYRDEIRVNGYTSMVLTRRSPTLSGSLWSEI